MSIGEQILTQRFELAIMRANVLAALEGRELSDEEIRSIVNAEADKIEGECWSMPEGCE